MKPDICFVLIFLLAAVGIPQPTATETVGDLPLVEVKPAQWEAGFIVFLFSGDGGWATIDQKMAKRFAERGCGVVGLNAKKYLWDKKTPEQCGDALRRIILHYSAAWGREKFLLVGYSRGASVIPFMVNRLPAELRPRVAMLALLGPDATEDFEFHWLGLLGFSSEKGARPVLPEIEKLRGTPILCICGQREDDSLCRSLSADLAKNIVVPGAHHFDGQYNKLADLILREYSAIAAENKEGK